MPVPLPGVGAWGLTNGRVAVALATQNARQQKLDKRYAGVAALLQPPRKPPGLLRP